jgi:hypothetical protein
VVLVDVILKNMVVEIEVILVEIEVIRFEIEVILVEIEVIRFEIEVILVEIEDMFGYHSLLLDLIVFYKIVVVSVLH